ncbi:MAG: arginine deiminase [Clostridiales bacterium]|nr:arginine deiminase [Clostridiales bacterium]
MSYIKLQSEIGKLNRVMLHSPGIEVEQLVPDYLEHMLFEDTPYIPVAKLEHKAFADVLESVGAEVVYLEDLFLEAIKSEQAKKEYIEDYIKVANINSQSLQEVIREYLSYKSDKELFYEVCKGIRRSDINVQNIDAKPLSLLVKDDYPFFTDPVPSLYFTRDISICIGNGMIISAMSMPFRKREQLFMRYIQKYHKDFQDCPLWYDYNLGFSVEGGDVLVLSDEVIAIGYSQRRSLGTIENIAKKLLRRGRYKHLIGFNLPKSRKFMHLDVLFTMVDYDKFLVAPQVLNEFDVYDLTLDSFGNLQSNNQKQSLRDILKQALGISAVDFIQVGGGDPIHAAREHWNMGSNSLAVAPGEIITYSRNDITNNLLVQHGIKVHTIPGGELSRGRGGPRCMSMPINRDSVR